MSDRRTTDSSRTVPEIADVAIIVIAKTPKPGAVKTRLCPPCTPAAAALLAAAALDDTLATVAATPAVARVLALDGPPGAWIPEGFVVVPQRGAGLDERLTHAFAAITGPALLVGMDTPQLSVEDLLAAAARLCAPGVDAVLGPAADGGWWSIGLRHSDARVFNDIPMSTDHTGHDQRARLDALGYRTVALEMMRDVDTIADARDVARLAPTSRFAAAVAAFERSAPGVSVT